MGHKIDYETFVFDGCLQKIMNVSSLKRNEVPELQKVWLVSFEPIRSSQFLKLVKEKVMLKDPVDFPYLKRIQKIKHEDGQIALIGIFCSIEFCAEECEVISLLGELKVLTISQKEVPCNYPYSKEICDQWSSQYWPVIWKGNPVIQELNQVKVNVEEERKYLQEICDISHELSREGVSNELMLIANRGTNNGQKLPIVTMFRDPSSDRTMIVQSDRRETRTPITHSIMDCIQQLADLELLRRKNVEEESGKYLCLNYHVYTTHEPCSMCVMALIHSRIGKLTYIKSSPITGGVEETSGLRYGVEKFSGLNWKFDSWKWCKDDLNVKPLDDNLFV